jgi:hypothetical protein
MNAEIFRWLLTGLITVLMILNFFWFKRWIGQQDEKWKTHEEQTKEQMDEWLRAGGVVTRENYYTWCQSQMSKCPACLGYRILTDWRNGMSDKGGIMLKTEGKELVKELTENFCEKIDQLFEHHREWVGQELKLLRLEFQKSQNREK